MKTARINEGKIAEILLPIPGFTLDQCFHPSILAGTVQVPDAAQVGDNYDPTATDPVIEEPAPVEPAADTVEGAA